MRQPRRVDAESERLDVTEGSLGRILDRVPSPLVPPADIARLVDASLDMLSLLDADGVPIYVSAASKLLFGYEPHELVGQNGLLHVHPDDRSTTRASLTRLLSGETVRQKYRLIDKQGDPVWVESQGQSSGDLFLIVTRNVSAQVELEQRLSHLALHDALTGLSNRHLLLAVLAAAIARAERSGRPLALLFLDLDDFKSVNDLHGHHCGDLLLQSVGQRLVRVLRRGDIVARLGGDEFVVLVQELPVPPDDVVEVIAQKVIRILEEPHRLDGVELRVGSSVGAAIWHFGQDADDLLQHADRMMYREKSKR